MVQPKFGQAGSLAAGSVGVRETEHEAMHPSPPVGAQALASFPFGDRSLAGE